MSILIDHRARDAIERRRVAGKPATIDLQVTPIFRGGSTLSVDWSSSQEGGHDPVVYVDPRIADYARWHDIVISAERVGPLESLVLKDPLTLMRVSEWERTHPGVGSGTAA